MEFFFPTLTGHHALPLPGRVYRTSEIDQTLVVFVSLVVVLEKQLTAASADTPTNVFNIFASARAITNMTNPD